MQSVVLKPRRDFSVRNRHPWIFSGAIAGGEAGSGETVAVVSAAGETLGYGSYSPRSQIRVRMLSFAASQVPDAALIAARVQAAVARRADLLAAGGASGGVRLVNAESDGLPGVVADCYAGWIVCQFTSAGAEYWKHTVAATLRQLVPACRGVSERTDLKDREKGGLPTAGEDGTAFQVLEGEMPPAEIEIAEGDCRFLVDVRRGHKTGFYLDQREARAAVGAWARGAEVLNCFCYTGGFGLFARAGGARRVTQVDISGDALALARKNEQLTFGDQQAEYVEADVFGFLRKCRDAGRKFDLIVLDPPKFAATQAQLMKAARGYKDINLLAMKLLKPNGVIATFSCSGAMTGELFDKVLAEASRDAGREFQVLTRTRQAADHPVGLAFPEGFYLKGVILRALD